MVSLLCFMQSVRQYANYLLIDVPQRNLLRQTRNTSFLGVMHHIYIKQQIVKWINCWHCILKMSTIRKLCLLFVLVEHIYGQRKCFKEQLLTLDNIYYKLKYLTLILLLSLLFLILYQYNYYMIIITIIINIILMSVSIFLLLS